MKWNRRKLYGACEEPELTILVALAHHHGAARFNISSLSISDMTQETIWAGLMTLEYKGYLRFYCTEAKLTGRGVETGLFLFSIYGPSTQAAASDVPKPHLPSMEPLDWCI